MMKMTKNSKCFLYVGVGFFAFFGIVLMLFKTLDKIHAVHEMMEHDRMAAAMPVHRGNDQTMNSVPLEDVSFCGVTYKTNKVIVNDVDVVITIAKVATRQKWICKNMELGNFKTTDISTVEKNGDTKDIFLVALFNRNDMEAAKDPFSQSSEIYMFDFKSNKISFQDQVDGSFKTIGNIK